MAFKKNRRPQANDPLASQVPAGYRPAFTPGSQGPGANNAFRNQAGASQYSRSNPQYSSQRSRRSGKGKKIALGVCCALIVALIGCGTAFAVWYNNVSSQLNTGGKTSEELENINEQLVSTNFNEPFYMMLIGSDKREGDDEGGARSDTNIVVRVDPVSNQATLVSIPRDTMIDIDGYGTNKFNAAYNYGGAAATRQASSILTASRLWCSLAAALTLMATSRVRLTNASLSRLLWTRCWRCPSPNCPALSRLQRSASPRI